MIDWVQRQVEASEYANWQLYFLMAAVGIGVSIYHELRFVTGFLHALDGFQIAFGYTIEEVFMAAIAGVVISLCGSFLFSEGSSFFAFLDSSYDTKETAFMVKVGLMTVLSIGLTLVLPDVVYAYAEYVVLQTFGLVLLTGYAMIHNDIESWDAWNEAPVFIGSAILLLAPFV